MEHVTEGSWESLATPLHPRVLGVLRELGFPYMTPVQVSAQVGRGGAERRAPGNGTRLVSVGIRTRIPEFSPMNWNFRHVFKAA